MKVVNILLLIFTFSCRSTWLPEGKNMEEREYKDIQLRIQLEQYTIAHHRIRIFQKDYPKSIYLCELQTYAANFVKTKGYLDYAIETYEEAYKSCKLNKDTERIKEIEDRLKELKNDKKSKKS